MGFGIQDILGGSLLDGISKIIGQFHLDPAKAAEIQAQLEAHKTDLEIQQAQLDAKLAEMQTREVEAASAAMQSEVRNDDKFTRRWRPAFGYMCTALIFWNYAIVPVFKQTPVQLPDALFQLFAAYLLMAVGARSWEKIVAIKENGAK